MPKGHWSASCFYSLADGRRCNQPAYFTAADGTWPVCREHASIESKFIVMATLTAALLRGLDARAQTRPPSVAPVERGPVIDPAEMAEELRRIFREDLDRAAQA